jgi:hypothetical protein
MGAWVRTHPSSGACREALAIEIKIPAVAESDVIWKTSAFPGGVASTRGTSSRVVFAVMLSQDSGDRWDHEDIQHSPADAEHVSSSRWLWICLRATPHLNSRRFTMLSIAFLLSMIGLLIMCNMWMFEGEYEEFWLFVLTFVMNELTFVTSAILMSR